MKPSALTDRLRSLQEQSALHNNLCSVGKFIARQDDDTQALLNELMDSSDVSTTKLYKELLPEPNHPDRGAIGDHRKKMCKCHSVNG